MYRVVLHYVDMRCSHIYHGYMRCGVVCSGRVCGGVVGVVVAWWCMMRVGTLVFVVLRCDVLTHA